MKYKPPCLTAIFFCLFLQAKGGGGMAPLAPLDPLPGRGARNVKYKPSPLVGIFLIQEVAGEGDMCVFPKIADAASADSFQWQTRLTINRIVSVSDFWKNLIVSLAALLLLDLLLQHPVHLILVTDNCFPYVYVLYFIIKQEFLFSIHSCDIRGS